MNLPAMEPKANGCFLVTVQGYAYKVPCTHCQREYPKTVYVEDWDTGEPRPKTIWTSDSLECETCEEKGECCRCKGEHWFVLYQEGFQALCILHPDSKDSELTNYGVWRRSPYAQLKQITANEASFFAREWHGYRSTNKARYEDAKDAKTRAHLYRQEIRASEDILRYRHHATMPVGISADEVEDL